MLTVIAALCLVLGLTASDVKGQRRPYSIQIGGNEVSNQTIPITMVGNDDDSALVCYSEYYKSEYYTAYWIYPNGSSVSIGNYSEDNFFSFIHQGSSFIRIVLLYRKEGAYSPTGRFCCGSRYTQYGRICVNLMVTLCPLLNITNGAITYSNETITRETVAYHTCNYGYKLTGEPNRTCLFNGINGTWSATELECMAVDCGQPPNISNGSPRTPSNRTYRGRVTYTCNYGYRQSGSSLVSCGANGNWTTLPTCTAVSCGSPPAISNGSFGTPTRITYEGTVTYSCNNGFVLSGPSTVTCEASRSWSPRPSCTAILVEVVPQSNLPLVGQNISLNCSVSGADSLNPTFNYKWFKEGANQTELQIGEEAILAIDSLVLSDVGQYKCVVNINSTIQPHVVSSDWYDLQFQTLNIQLRFNGILNCRQYTSTEATQKTNDITNGLVEAIESRCRCGFNSSLLSGAFLRCFDKDSPHHVTYRAMMTATGNTTTVEMVSIMKEWLTTNSRMIVQTVQLGINSTCPVAIVDLDGPECPEAIDTRSTVTAATPTMNSFPPYAGGAITGVLVIVAIVAAVVAMVLLIVKNRNTSKQNNSTKKQREVPLSKLNQLDSSHPESHDYEDMEVGRSSYEIVDHTQPQPPKGSYDDTSCPGVSGGRGKVRGQVTHVYSK